MAIKLPPLQTLRAFEAAARRLSMTLAAEELHLTHGAISRQIKSLEDDLGVRLFRRLTRKIELTDTGSMFFGVVTRLLSELAREADNIRCKPDDNRLIVSTGVSFASKWLAPRLHKLMSRYPDFDVQLEVTDNDLDFEKSKVDVAIRYGSGYYFNAEAERIMNETVSPVCTPEYSRYIGDIDTITDLSRCTLVHENGMTTTWADWFKFMGISVPRMRGPGYSHGSMSIEAAIRSEGIALGRSVLVAEDLASGRLVELFPKIRLEVEHGYDLVYAVGNHDHSKVQAVRNWIISEIQH